MKSQQQGMVLLISLMLLLMLTIIAITAATQSNLQLRISSNSQQQNIAFQAAESGLQNWAKEYFKPGSSWHPNATGTNGLLASTHSQWQYAAAPIGGTPPQIPMADGMGMSQGLLVVRFDVVSTGCTSADCTIRAVHRQGLQNRYIP